MPTGSDSPPVEPIRLVDRNSDLSRFADISEDLKIQSLIRGLLHNRQITEPDDEDAEYLVDSLKYTREQIPRRSLSPLTDFTDYDIERARRMLNLLTDEDPNDGYEALEFQLRSWEAIAELDDARRRDGEHRGVNLSAPTGFGKTWAFMGPIYDKVLNDRDFSTAILVFPRRALLRDQLSGILNRLNKVNNSDEFDSSFTVGTWISNLPWERSDVTDTSNTGVGKDGAGRTVFTLADYWDEDSAENNLYISENQDELFNDDVTISLDDFMFAKEEIKNEPPDILLTTLESLELFSLKPHYDILDNTDALVFDEVHQYNGLNGAHAANIISNLKSIHTDPLLFLGVSATLENPQSFGEQLFGLTGEDQLRTIKPTDDDYETDNNDYRNHYFLLSREDGAGAASMYIQEMMLLGHSMLDPPQTGEAGEVAKILSFIDSKSQIHQRGNQFADADAELWQYHDSANPNYVGGDPNDDYRQVANDSGHNFIERSMQIDGFHADSDNSISDLDNMEIIQCTSSLEVGIDIDDIEIITQYREPLGGLSAFVQRVGRAGREKGTDAHAVTFLSSYAGDSNFYYRADRFLQSGITTPLRTDNQIISDIHDMSLVFYEELQELYEDNPSTWHRANHVELDLLEQLFVDRLEAEDFHKFLTNTNGSVYSLAGFRPGTDSLLSEGDIQTVRSAINEEQEDLEAEIKEIEILLGEETDQVIQGTDPVNGLLDRVADNALNLLARIESSIDTESSDTDEILEQITEIRQTIDDAEGLAIDQRLNEYQIMSSDLMILQGKLSLLEGTLPDTDPINEINQSLEKLSTAIEDGTIERQQIQRKQLHYLSRSVDKIEKYVHGDYRVGSLYHMKHLFRAAFFFDQCLRLHDDEEATGLNYYPDDYFGGGGKTFTLNPESRHERTEEVPITRVISQYAPFKSEYLARVGEMQVFVPDMREQDGEIVMSFDSVPGRREDNIKIPERIPMDAVEDVTQEQSHGIVYYDPVQYNIFRNYQAVPPHINARRGKIHSEPHVMTKMEHIDDQVTNGSLKMGNVSAEVALEGVTLEISTAYYHEDSDEFRFTGDTDEEFIPSTDPKLGFVLDTRGVSLELDDFIANLSAVRDDVAQFKNLDEMTLKEIGLNTTAHFLSLMIADVSGVNAEELLHGYDNGDRENDDSKSVFVFEQSEGGQGVVDLFFETLEAKPREVLQSMLRLLYNSQIELEKLCAEPEFVDRITSIDPSNEEARQGMVRDVTGISLPPVVQRISEEVLALVDRVDDIADECGMDDPTEIYQLKHRLSHERLSGTAIEDIPDALYQDFGPWTTEVTQDYLEELLVSPDIDGCAANLHMNTTLFNVKQSESLSYVVVEQLRDHLLERVDSANDAETILDRGQLWGGEDDAEVIFPAF